MFVGEWYDLPNVIGVRKEGALTISYICFCTV